MSAPAEGPLAGLTVIEMAGIGPCPLAGQLMADLGAEVILVERAAGEARPEDVNNRNKKSVVIDLKSPQGVNALLGLVDRADILIEGFRPGVMERLGMGPQVCHARNPRLIFGRITGWGQTGPLAPTAGHDLNYLAVTGALHMMGTAGHPPMPPLNLVADYGGGTMFLLLGVLSALYERSRSGRGQVVDAAMVDGVSLMAGVFRMLSARNQWSGRREDNLLDGGAPFYRVYETADGKFLSVGALESQFFAELVHKSGMDTELAARRDDHASWSGQREDYASLFRSKTRAEWEAIFASTDACVAPVLSPDEAVEYVHNRERGAYVEVGGMMQPAPAPRFDRTPAGKPRAAPAAGSDTEAILAEAAAGGGSAER